MIEQNKIKIVAHKSNQYWESVKLRHDILRQPLGLKFTDEELEDEHNQIHIVYITENKIVGCIVLIPDKQTKLKMRQVAVAVGMQRKGVGKNLIKYAEEYAVLHGFTILSCHARKIAKQFYLQLGYQIEGKEFLEISIPHFKMYKKL